MDASGQRDMADRHMDMGGGEGRGGLPAWQLRNAIIIYRERDEIEEEHSTPPQLIWKGA